MQAQDEYIKDIVTDSRRFRVPNYQRLYSWDVYNCSQFWEDLHRQILLNEQDKEGNPGGHDHYLGALVVKDSGKKIENSISELLIVDGQQRLTTMSLVVATLLKSIYLYDDKDSKDHSYQATCRKITKSLKSFIQIDTSDFINETDSKYRYRIELIEENNAVYRSLIDFSLNDNESISNQSSTPLDAAYNYFLDTIKKEISKPGCFNSSEKLTLQGLHSIEKVFNALKWNIKLIYTTLDQDDEVQQIFEALNNRGAPLTDEDLIKNYFMMLADSAESNKSGKSGGVKGDLLYKNYWKSFDGDGWWRTKRKNTGQTNLGFFLFNYLLQARLTSGQHPPITNLYRDFRDHSAEIIAKSGAVIDGLDTLLSDVKKASEEFKTYDRIIFKQGPTLERKLPLPNDRFEEFVERIGTLETYSWQLILWLAKNRLRINNEKEFIKTIDIVEAWLIRRKISRLPNTHSGIRRLCEYFQKLKPEELEQISTKTKSFIATSTGSDVDVMSFPGDQAVKEAIENDEITIKLAHVILLAIEDKKRAKLSPRISRDREVEHIMPQKWKEHWSGPNVNEQERLRAIQALGNLTLLSSPPNKTVSNKNFSFKKNLYAIQDAMLTKEVASEYQSWSEKEIHLRGTSLLEEITFLWPNLDKL